MRYRIRVWVLGLLTFDINKRFLRKDTRACWILDARIELDQSFMKLAEWLIFLAYVPSFTIKMNMDNILCILAIVLLIHVDSCLLDSESKRQTEKWNSLMFNVLSANLDMVNEGIALMKHLTVLALNNFSIFKGLLVAFHQINFTLQCLVSIFHLSYCLR